MAKRAGKLQEFVAHASNVNCLRIGRKSGQVLVTGGDDKKVNMWAIGKPSAIMSLSGHTSPVECVTFDTAEEVVVAGSAGGTLKLWDLEQAKVVRTLTGHRANAVSVDFHPYGEFFASGSLDTNLKVWDIRRKNCIWTYRGHTKGVNVIRFSPDGRWVVSGGEDGTVKLWDLTAGKLMHDFTTHEGPITSIDFHPNEFLLATGSADRTVKFWDLETFELVSSTDLDAHRVRGITFTPDGRALLAGSQDSLKVWGWEPSNCFDTLDVGWGKVADMNITNDQLVACSYNQTFVGVWIVNMQQMQPFGGARTPTENQELFPTKPTAPPTVPAPAPAPVPAPAPATAAPREPAAAVIPTRPVVAKKAPPPTAPSERSQPMQEEPVRDRPKTNASSEPSKAADVKSMAVGTTQSLNNDPSVPKQSVATSMGESFKQLSEPSAKPKPKRKDGPDFEFVAPVAPRYEDSTPAAPAKREPSAPARPQLVPADRKGSVGLDLDAFMNPATVISPDAAPATELRPDDSIIKEVLEPHHKMCTILTNRSTNVRACRTFWDQGDVRGTLENLARLKDPSVTVDVLGTIGNKPNVFNLELCAVALPLANDLLSSAFEEYIQTAVKVTMNLYKTFHQVIKSTRGAPAAVGVDLNREERLERCNLCYQKFIDIRNSLEPLVGKSGGVGQSCRELKVTLDAL